MPNRVAHFEIHADDLERAIKFYTDIFGWEIKKWESPGMEYWMIMTGKQDEPGGINGGMLKRPCPTPAVGTASNAYVCTIVVDDIDAIGASVLAHGGIEAMPKFLIADMAWQWYFLDTEGNTFGIHQPLKKM